MQRVDADVNTAYEMENVRHFTNPQAIKSGFSRCGHDRSFAQACKFSFTDFESVDITYRTRGDKRTNLIP